MSLLAFSVSDISPACIYAVCTRKELYCSGNFNLTLVLKNNCFLCFCKNMEVYCKCIIMPIKLSIMKGTFCLRVFISFSQIVNSY